VAADRGAALRRAPALRIGTEGFRSHRPSTPRSAICNSHFAIGPRTMRRRAKKPGLPFRDRVLISGGDARPPVAAERRQWLHYTPTSCTCFS
jgi:hypothetical protein